MGNFCCTAHRRALSIKPTVDCSNEAEQCLGRKPTAPELLPTRAPLAAIYSQAALDAEDA